MVRGPQPRNSFESTDWPEMSIIEHRLVLHLPEENKAMATILKKCSIPARNCILEVNGRICLIVPYCVVNYWSLLQSFTISNCGADVLFKFQAHSI